MITLKLNLANEAAESIEVKSISAAWNQIRKIRDTDAYKDKLEGVIMEVSLPEGITSDRIPARILFRTNKNGKIEFKDADKLLAREAARKEQKSKKDQDM